MPATATTPLRRALTALLLCVFTLQTVVGSALAGEVVASEAAGYGAFQVPLTAARPTWGIPAAGGQALDGLGRRVRWDFVVENGPAYKAEVVRDVVGRVASLTFGFTPSATAHWRGYGYDAATRLSDAWSWDGPAPAPDVSALLHHEVGAGQVAAFANDLAGVLHAPFDRAPQGGDLLSIGDAYEVTSARGPGHRLTALEVDGVAVTVDHDATGRVVEANPGYAFEYDPDERLMAVRDVGTGDIVERFAYDAFGRLAATYDANGLTQRFAWDGAQMVGAFDGAGLAKWDAVWGEFDQRGAFRDRSAHPAGDVTVLPITDHRNSVVGAVASDASGTTLLAGADYTPMGRVVTLDPAGDDTETCREAGHPGTRCPHPGDMPFGFAGAWRSEATGLVYMRFRWYSPALGQFLTPDPMGEVDGWNLYAYVGGDPINRWDPWGLDASAFADAALDGVAPAAYADDHGGEPPPVEPSSRTMMPGVGPGAGQPRPQPGRMPPLGPWHFPGPEARPAPVVEPPLLRPAPLADPPTQTVRSCLGSAWALLVCATVLIPGDQPHGDPPADLPQFEAGPLPPQPGAGTGGVEVGVGPEGGSAASKGAPSAFEIAQAGGKHAGFLRNYVGRSPAKIQRGIASLERQVAEHQAKNANPEKFIEGWSKFDPRQQQALVNSKWPSDIARQTEQIEVLMGLLGGGR